MVFLTWFRFFIETRYIFYSDIYIQKENENKINILEFICITLRSKNENVQIAKNVIRC